MKSGWERICLRDLAIIETGKWDANHAVVGGEYRFYTCATKYMYCNTKRFSGNCLVFPGNGANVGEVYFYNGEFDAYQRTYVLHSISQRLLPRLLYYHFLSNWKSVGTAKQYGSATNFIKIGNFNDYSVSFPSSLTEQQRIVDVLDREFAKIDALKANSERSLQVTMDLFQATLKKELEPKEGWETKHLNEWATYSIGLTYKPVDVSKEGTIVLRSSNIQNDELVFDDIVRVSCKVKDELFVENGDILMCSRNGSARLVGKVARIGKEQERMTYGTFMTIIRSKYNPILFYYFKSNDFRSQISKGENTMINQITKYMLNDVVISLPNDPGEVSRIACSLDNLNGRCKSLQENYQKTLALCDDLKQSLLRKAFSGEL